jgi:hypothetical protein
MLNVDFLRLTLLDAKLPARCFLNSAKGGYLPPPDSYFGGEDILQHSNDVFVSLYLDVLSGPVSPFWRS